MTTPVLMCAYLQLWLSLILRECYWISFSADPTPANPIPDARRPFVDGVLADVANAAEMDADEMPSNDAVKVTVSKGTCQRFNFVGEEDPCDEPRHWVIEAWVPVGSLGHAALSLAGSRDSP